MRFLLDANLPRSASAAVRQFGHEAVDVRDIGLGGVPARLIASHAKVNGLALVTREFDFSDVRNYPPAEYAGIIVLQASEDANTADILKILKSILSQPLLISLIAGHLAIVESWRVRLRPALR